LSERIGKYLLEERIGAGGMAEVYRARVQGPQGFEKIVAVKRVLPIFGDDQDFVRMFIQEARVAARLQHANIVQIFDFDQEKGRYYIAMEYVAGKDLRVALRAAGAPPAAPGIPVALALFVTGEVLRALHYAQQTSGLVHRDISPHNVLLGYSGDVKLGDFGIAKAQAAASATRTGSIKMNLGSSPRPHLLPCPKGFGQRTPVSPGGSDVDHGSSSRRAPGGGAAFRTDSPTSA